VAERFEQLQIPGIQLSALNKNRRQSIPIGPAEFSELFRVRWSRRFRERMSRIPIC
jgi:hypothetical protein